MQITYIHHSSFLVETELSWLLFDYFEGDLPPIGKDKPLYVFSSHRHADHFSPVIFTKFGDYPQVCFILSSDISPKKVPENLLGKTHFMRKGEKMEFGPLQVETLRSTDEGVAFLVREEERILYHAGDLNNWFWKGEDKGWNAQMEKNYRKEIAKLPDTLEVAFVPVDPRLEEAYDLGVRELLENREIIYLFPMHFWKDFSVCKKLQATLGSSSCTVMQIEHTQQNWRLP